MSLLLYASIQRVIGLRSWLATTLQRMDDAPDDKELVQQILRAGLDSLPKRLVTAVMSSTFSPYSLISVEPLAWLLGTNDNAEKLYRYFVFKCELSTKNSNMRDTEPPSVSVPVKFVGWAEMAFIEEMLRHSYDITKSVKRADSHQWLYRNYILGQYSTLLAGDMRSGGMVSSGRAKPTLKFKRHPVLHQQREFAHSSDVLDNLSKLVAFEQKENNIHDSGTHSEPPFVFSFVQKLPEIEASGTDLRLLVIDVISTRKICNSCVCLLSQLATYCRTFLAPKHPDVSVVVRVCSFFPTTNGDAADLPSELVTTVVEGKAIYEQSSVPVVKPQQSRVIEFFLKRNDASFFVDFCSHTGKRQELHRVSPLSGDSINHPKRTVFLSGLHKSLGGTIARELLKQQDLATTHSIPQFASSTRERKEEQRKLTMARRNAQMFSFEEEKNDSLLDQTTIILTRSRSVSARSDSIQGSTQSDKISALSRRHRRHLSHYRPDKMRWMPRNRGHTPTSKRGSKSKSNGKKCKAKKKKKKKGQPSVVERGHTPT